MEECLTEALGLLNELSTDYNTSKNVKQIALEVITILEEEVELPVKCDKAIQTLTVCEGQSMDPFTKTRIWSLLSMLESVS